MRKPSPRKVRRSGCRETLIGNLWLGFYPHATLPICVTRLHASICQQLGSIGTAASSSTPAGNSIVCAAGLNLVLVSRTESKLQELAEALQSFCSIQTKYMVMDFANTNDSVWTNFTDVVGALDVGVLVNNVGLSYPHAEFYDKIDDQLAADIVAINITATNRVSLRRHSLLCPRHAEGTRL